MLISNGDGTYTAGALDVLMILHNVEAGTFHAAFFEEAPPPGPVKDVMDVDIVRLRSKMHHTTGSPTLDGAKEHLKELAQKIHLPNDNVWMDKDPFEWDGNLGITILSHNWKQDTK